MKPPPHEQIRDLAEILQLLLAHIAGVRLMSTFEYEECLAACERILKD